MVKGRRMSRWQAIAFLYGTVINGDVQRVQRSRFMQTPEDVLAELHQVHIPHAHDS